MTNKTTALALAASEIARDSEAGELVTHKHDPILNPRTSKDLADIAKMVGASGLFGVRGTADAFTIMLTGRSLNLDVMTSLRAIHVVEGKPTLSADLMLAICRRSPTCEFFKLIESNSERCVYAAKKVGDSEVYQEEFTIEDAARAELLSRKAWKKYPEQMLRARCLSKLARREFPGLLMGMYTPDEILSEIEDSAPPQPSELDVIYAANAGGGKTESQLKKPAIAKIYRVLLTADNAGDASRALVGYIRSALDDLHTGTEDDPGLHSLPFESIVSLGKQIVGVSESGELEDWIDHYALEYEAQENAAAATGDQNNEGDQGE